ncbi:MAG: polysaccharide biosynthesis protein, partial [Exilispira sp.]
KLKQVIDDNGVNIIYIAIPSAKSEQITRITSIIRKIYPDITIKIIPSILEITSNIPLLYSLRDISIEDLLGRSEISIDIESIHHLFSGKKILVTGAGGSIGSEICRQLLKYNISQLIAIGRGEYSIYNLIKELEKFKTVNNISKDIVYKIANIKNIDLMNSIFEEYRPDIVFHAAAHKHVPLMEFNEAEAIHNNIYGTKYVLDLSLKYDVKNFILVSTDKAVNPVNIMGATKRAAEILALYYNNLYNLKTTIVRFGNVIGSRGSVIPLFIEQVNSGGPITITHPDIVRYFMTIPEAATLMLNAAAYSKGGDIFVLDMGKQYKIIDIAYNLIKFFGLEPEKDIKIEFTGLRPGEKLYEELYFNKEKMLKTFNDKILQIKPEDINIDKDSVEKIIQTQPIDLFKMTGNDIRKWLKNIVYEYNYEENSSNILSGKKFVS